MPEFNTLLKPARPVGIIGYGAYVPRYRLPAREVARIWTGGKTSGLPIKEKAVPGQEASRGEHPEKKVLAEPFQMDLEPGARGLVARADARRQVLDHPPIRDETGPGLVQRSSRRLVHPAIVLQRRRPGERRDRLGERRTRLDAANPGRHLGGPVIHVLDGADCLAAAEE